MAVAGVDVSSHAIAVALLDDDTDDATGLHYPIHVKGGTAFDAARQVREALPHRFQWTDHGVWLLGLEDPYSLSIGTAKALGLVTGALLACLPDELTIVRMAPNEWQRIFLSGQPLPQGRAQRKARVARRATSLGFDPSDQDLADAYGIAWAVRALNQGAVEGASAG